MATITTRPTPHTTGDCTDVFRDGRLLGTVCDEICDEICGNGWCVWVQARQWWTARHLPTRDRAMSELLAEAG